jgi:hypothetical protein
MDTPIEDGGKGRDDDKAREEIGVVRDANERGELALAGGENGRWWLADEEVERCGLVNVDVDTGTDEERGEPTCMCTLGERRVDNRGDR